MSRRSHWHPPDLAALPPRQAPPFRQVLSDLEGQRHRYRPCRLSNPGRLADPRNLSRPAILRALANPIYHCRQQILAEGIKADGVAQLCDLPVGEVHRLRRAAQAAQNSRGDDDPAYEVQPRSLDEQAASGAALSRRSERGPAQLPPGQSAITVPAR